jgi:hypothetical protein
MNILNPETGEVTSVELQSIEINELAKALAKAQGVMTSAQKDGMNPHYGKSYATLASIFQATRKPLTDNGLSVVQVMLPDNTLVTTLMHESGQWLRSYLKLNPAQNTPQGVGSALTYGRRYSLAAIVGISQDDDDGEEATAPTKQTPKKVEPVKEQPSPGNVWLPTKEEFFEQVESQLKVKPDEAKVILKAAQFVAFTPDKATNMFKAIEKELRIKREAVKIAGQVSH